MNIFQAIFIFFQVQQVEKLEKHLKEADFELSDDFINSTSSNESACDDLNILCPRTMPGSKQITTDNGVYFEGALQTNPKSMDFELSKILDTNFEQSNFKIILYEGQTYLGKLENWPTM